MALTHLSLSGFRNIDHAELELAPGANLFCGPNGSGKTSLLEAVHMLSTGRSFRSRQHGAVIQEGRDDLTVFGRLDSGYRLGVERTRGGAGRININSAPAQSSSQLASCLPLQLINSESFSALDGGAGARRRLLDWAVFHVEHSYAQEWKDYQLALRQRNALLRRGKIIPELIAPWEERLAESGERLHRFRLQVFARLDAALAKLIGALEGSPLQRVQLSFRSGWRKETSLRDALVESREGDLAQGHTRVGPHRADLRFAIAGEMAHNVLSRGQQKMLVCALRTAMAQLVGETGEKPVFVVDDLPAELDEQNQQQFARWVSGCASQVLVTGIDARVTGGAWRELAPPWNRPKLFHVEHGHISAAAAD